MVGLNQDTATRAEELIHRVEVYTQAIKVCMDELKMLIGRKHIEPQRDVEIVEVASIRLSNICTGAGIYTLGQLADLHKTDFYKIRAVGRKTFEEARRILEEHGLSFKAVL